MKPLGTPTRVDDLIASYSSKGPTVVDAVVKPDLVAPGNMLTSLEAQNSTLYNELPGNQVPFNYYVKGGSSAISSTYFTLSGTSMATGIVSGVVADLLQKSPRATPDQVKARLMLTAYLSSSRGSAAPPIQPPASPTPRPVRRLHHRRRLCGRRSCSKQHCRGERDGDVSCHHL